MQTTDVAIVGGGLAGSLAAAMLGRAGIDAVLIDPHTEYPPDLRCEKLDGSQVAILRKTGLADLVLKATTYDRTAWIARFGRVIEKRVSDQQGVYYADLVNTVRSLIPGTVTVIHDKVAAATTGGDRQVVRLAGGEEISARLVVLAHGLNMGFAHALGLSRRDLSTDHSVTIGFDLAPVGRSAFPFSALTYYPEHARDRLAYITMFPIGANVRANFMVYRNVDDPWLRRMRKTPEAALLEVMPRLGPILGDFKVTSFVQIRPATLYRTEGVRQPGLVLVGDAFSTSCPAAGNGATKVLNDVERLCNVHIPNWLATPGMAVDKIGSFYDDPVKQACDAACAAKAWHLKALSTDPDPVWAVRRIARFVVAGTRGLVRAVARPLGGRQPSYEQPAKRAHV